MPFSSRNGLRLLVGEGVRRRYEKAVHDRARVRLPSEQPSCRRLGIGVIVGLGQRLTWRA